MKNVLVIDDDSAVTNYFMVFLMQTDLFEPTVVNDPREVEDILAKEKFDVIMLDLDMPNVTGMDILKMMRAKGYSIPVVILTGVSDVDLAVKAMKQGAFDYLTKPVDDNHLLEVLGNAMEHSAMHDKIGQMPDVLTTDNLHNEAVFKRLPTEDPDTIRVLHQAENIAQGDLGVFIWGERGTGKRWMARAIHNASPRAGKPFVALDPSSPTGESFSVELFGRSQDWSGKFGDDAGWLEKASGGTLFINNIEHLSLADQLRLNKVLQGGDYYRNNSTEIRKCDVRFIVASSHDLTNLKYRDSFSRDLLYHLMVNSIRIPPLRDRPNDLPLMIRYFLEMEVEKTGKEVAGCCDDLLELLHPYSFPGNLQELHEIVASAVAKTNSDMISIESLSRYTREKIALGAVKNDFIPRKMRHVIHHHVRETVGYCDGDLLKAAKLLDISPDKLQEYLTIEEAPE